MGSIEFPSVPQTLKLFSKVTPGTRFMFTGRCSDKNFSFALVTPSEIAILLVFEMENERIIKAKSFYNEEWSKEILYRNPIRADGDFFVQIVARKEFFEIYSGGSFLFNVDYSVPIELISGIRLMEEMQVYRVEMQ